MSCVTDFSFCSLKIFSVFRRRARITFRFILVSINSWVWPPVRIQADFLLKARSPWWRCMRIYVFEGLTEWLRERLSQPTNFHFMHKSNEKNLILRHKVVKFDLKKYSKYQIKFWLFNVLLMIRVVRIDLNGEILDSIIWKPEAVRWY